MLSVPHLATNVGELHEADGAEQVAEFIAALRAHRVREVTRRDHLGGLHRLVYRSRDGAGNRPGHQAAQSQAAEQQHRQDQLGAIEPVLHVLGMLGGEGELELAGCAHRGDVFLRCRKHLADQQRLGGQRVGVLEQRHQVLAQIDVGLALVGHRGHQRLALLGDDDRLEFLLDLGDLRRGLLHLWGEVLLDLWLTRCLGDGQSAGDIQLGQPGPLADQGRAAVVLLGLQAVPGVERQLPERDGEHARHQCQQGSKAERQARADLEVVQIHWGAREEERDQWRDRRTRLPTSRISATRPSPMMVAPDTSSTRR
jgi:hypothetical protein